MEDCLYTLSIVGLRFENYCLIKFKVDIIKGKQQPSPRLRLPLESRTIFN